MQNSPVPKSYCQLCKKKYKDAAGLEFHRNSKKHQQKLPHTCEICQGQVPNFDALKVHVQQMAHAALCCPTCHNFFPYKNDLDKHMKKRKHGRAPPSQTRSTNRPTNILATASARPKYHCDQCYITFSATTEFEQHTLSPDHLKTVQRQKVEKESLAKTNPRVPIHHCPACHLIMKSAQELRYHITEKKHIAQVQRMSTYLLNAGYEVDFGFVSSISGSGDPDVILAIANPFVSSYIELELTSIRRNQAPSTVYHTDQLDTSPFSIAISDGTTLGPLQSVSAKITFNPHGLHDGNYVMKAMLEFSTELAIPSETPVIFKIPVTLRATLGDVGLLAKLAPEGKYTRSPKTRDPDAFHAHDFNPGVKPPMLLVKSYKVPLGKNKIPNELLKLLARPLAEQVAMPRFKDLVPLTTATYEAYFSTMVHAEEHQMNIDIRAFDLRGVVIKKTGGGGAFVLEVPGLAENRPSVLYGDRVLLLPEGAAAEARPWEGFAHEIHETKVVLHFDNKFPVAWKKESRWDVRFTFSRTALQRMHESVKKMGGVLRQAQSPGDVWRQRLFPMRAYGHKQKQEKTELADMLRNLKTKDEKIGNNPEQLRAVAIALTGVHGSVPLLVFGPPGTGKTSTMIECIYQLLCHPSQAGKPVRILATAPTNLMTDLILQRLSPYFSPKEMIRVNAPSRGVPLLHPSLEPYCRLQKTYGRPLYNFPTLPELKSFNVVVSTCGAAGILYGIGGASLGFTHVFVDEAGQALEPEVLLALQLLENNLASGRVILCGDPYQLGPVVRSPLSKHFEYNISLLERLVRFSDSDAGAERKVIIMSTVRATKALVEMDKGHAIGFVGDPKRFNVAVTRARALCCVIGDARVLKEDPWWREWIEFVKRGGGWVGPEVEFEDDVEGLANAVQELSVVEEDEDEEGEEDAIHGLVVGDTEKSDVNSDDDDVVFVAGERGGASGDGNDVVVAPNAELQWRELE
ncbi:hypothetical protein BC936DRAFT_146171 [Jimgerdemannia flammicorona]|uniref:RNA helicase n=1 Tax=Jimgerdemannia flammicorona TaxID=994334 RepID=A0A433DNR8_9FUNG|nr:hypothetical protein BC936DRAFT_146171 [Jimgerdemannia flammicorona]